MANYRNGIKYIDIDGYPRKVIGTLTLKFKEAHPLCDPSLTLKDICYEVIQCLPCMS